MGENGKEDNDIVDKKFFAVLKIYIGLLTVWNTIVFM